MKVMGNINDKDFSVLFEKLVDIMTSPEIFTREKLIEVLVAICKLFDISKGITEFYESIWDEKIGHGEILEDYNDGREGEIAVFRRIVTPNLTVIKHTLYRPKDSFPLADEDKYRLDLAVRTLLSFISRNRLQTAVEKLAFYDQAGYPNLNYFMRYLDKLDQEKKFLGKAAIMFNIQNFSLVNADFGKETGDKILKLYYDAIKQTIGDDGIICRMGGDNFISIFNAKLTDRMEQMMLGYPVLYDKENSKRIMLSSCAGIFEITEKFDFKRPAEIIRVLFGAINEARTDAGGTIVYAAEKDSDEKQKFKRVRSLFPDSLKAGEFKVYYQPKVNIETGKVSGGEALCRWFHNDKLFSPADFIPVLEQSNEICRLDMYMLDIACKDIKRWIDTEILPVRISVNLSRKHLSNIDLVNQLTKIVDKYNIPHKYIEFEFTESTTSVGINNLKRVVDELRSRGFVTAVDDFGMGYSSLNLIREIPWDVLKLDKNFLPGDEEPENSVTSLMYQHVASMAHDIGLETVTEGVETAAQLQILRANKCIIAQGFYFDKPMPVDQFEERLRRGYKI